MSKRTSLGRLSSGGRGREDIPSLWFLCDSLRLQCSQGVRCKLNLLRGGSNLFLYQEM